MLRCAFLVLLFALSDSYAPLYLYHSASRSDYAAFATEAGVVWAEPDYNFVHNCTQVRKSRSHRQFDHSAILSSYRTRRAQQTQSPCSRIIVVSTKTRRTSRRQVRKRENSCVTRVYRAPRQKVWRACKRKDTNFYESKDIFILTVS